MTNKKINVLLVTYFPIRDDLSTGNTIINLFSKLEKKFNISNIYIKDGEPNNTIISNYFHISEKELIKSIFLNRSIGNEMNESKSEYDDNKYYKKARQLRWDSLLLLQDIISLAGKIDYNELDKFIHKVNPDVIFGPLGRVPLPNKLMTYICKKYSIPLITYPWDDHYSLKKISFSPFFWLRVFLERKYIRTCANESKMMLTIIDSMKEEYEKIFNKTCYVLNKSYDFSTRHKCVKKITNPIKLLYVGNLGAGRYKTLIKIVNAMQKINKKEKKVALDIYTSTPLSNKVKERLSIPGCSTLNKAVPNSIVLSLMKNADVLVHITPFGIKERLLERLSFSTKVVDYFYSSKCILSVGGKTATTKYLQKNDAAIVVNDQQTIYETINNLIENHELIYEYAEKAWKCGLNNHNEIDEKETIVNLFNEVTFGGKR